jgi:predicted Rossmann fold nucleotide-binding protein DprA/Smf involved in DNA uptake
MSNNSMAIVILCSFIGAKEGVQPFTVKQWHEFSLVLKNQDLTPADLLKLSGRGLLDVTNGDEAQTKRIEALSARSGSLAFEIERLRNRGILIATRADKDYPQALKKKLKDKAPPLFYYTGNLVLANFQNVGFVGSRSIGDKERGFMEKIVPRVIEKNYGVVSGGAKGVDAISSEMTIGSNAYAVEFVADSLEKKLRNSSTIRRIADEKLLILSASVPSSGFDVGAAMARNKYIYASSEGTVIVKSDLGKGGTWSGAAENLKHGWCNTFCWNNALFPGNQELIRMGAIGIDDDWDADIDMQPAPRPNNQHSSLPKTSNVQLSFL